LSEKGRLKVKERRKGNMGCIAKTYTFAHEVLQIFTSENAGLQNSDKPIIFFELTMFV
jgi:hypothetical protein